MHTQYHYKYIATAEPASQVCSPIEDTENVDILHVQCLIDSLPADLTDEQRDQATHFIRSYSGLFSKSAKDLCCNGVLPHRINTADHPPIRQPLRRQPYAHIAEIIKNVQEMLSAGVI